MSCWTWLRSSLYYLCGESFWVNICLRLQCLFSVMKVDTYYVPRSCITCSDQTCLWERVRGNVCISWSNGGWWCGKLTTLISRSTWVFTLLCCLTRDKLKYHVARDEGDKLLPMARPNMFLFSLYVMKLKAILWVILITEVLRFSSHLGGV